MPSDHNLPKMSSPKPGTSSPAPTPSSSSTSLNRHALTASESQRAQLDRLLKDPAKPVHIPQAPKEKTIRPAREMMKNVQGSSAGAGSGEFHVYKAARRREYERLKIMEETTQKVCSYISSSSPLLGCNGLLMPIRRKLLREIMKRNNNVGVKQKRPRRRRTARNGRRRKRGPVKAVAEAIPKRTILQNKAQGPTRRCR